MWRSRVARVVHKCQAEFGRDWTGSREGCIVDGLECGSRVDRRNLNRFQGGLVFKAHRLLYHSTLGLRVIKMMKTEGPCGGSDEASHHAVLRLVLLLHLRERGARDNRLRVRYTRLLIRNNRLRARSLGCGCCFTCQCPPPAFRCRV